jgi:hypothetical protein
VLGVVLFVMNGSTVSNWSQALEELCSSAASTLEGCEADEWVYGG